MISIFDNGVHDDMRKIALGKKCKNIDTCLYYRPTSVPGGGENERILGGGVLLGLHKPDPVLN